MLSFNNLFAMIINSRLLIKQAICWWFHTPYCSCEVILIRNQESFIFNIQQHFTITVTNSRITKLTWYKTWVVPHKSAGEQKNFRYSWFWWKIHQGTRPLYSNGNSADDVLYIIDCYTICGQCARPHERRIKERLFPVMRSWQMNPRFTTLLKQFKCLYLCLEACLSWFPLIKPHRDLCDGNKTC